ncbi:hypothetical protein RRG08_017476 [Elysia crispata]|uniref:Uncharacterized protein n=1 Tax=Elysia crispata TaxID=231223 RepID=A0AAE0YIC2_9GAST|nr:hypothetical protein RRG08_017476 [Elysia crispata]
MVQEQTLSWYKSKLCHGTRPNFVMVQDQTLSWYKTKLCHGTRPNFVLINRFRFAGNNWVRYTTPPQMCKEDTVNNREWRHQKVR